MVLKENNIVKKRHVLNEIRRANMNLTELRFFAIYLSKIHKDKPAETRLVRFPVEDFQAIMELGRIDIQHMKKTVDSLLCKIVTLPTEVGGYTKFQLFKECTVSKDEKEQWYVEIDAHDKALPLMFEFKERHFLSYRLFNALRLRSTNQLRMYEVLKQWQTAGEKEFDVDELKELLWIGKDEYSRYLDFNNRVLKVCQKALLQHTDIKFTYEPTGKRGKGGKVYRLKFTIEANEDFTDQLTLDMFIAEQKADIEQEADTEPPTDLIDFLSGACNGEFSREQITVLKNLILEKAKTYDQNEIYDHLKRRYDYLVMQSKRKTINSRFGYVKSIIGKEI